MCCNKCGKKYYSTIHKVEPSTKSDLSTSNQAVQATCSSTNQSSSIFHTLLATVQVNVIFEKGDKIQIRALVDPGSQISFISTDWFKNFGCYVNSHRSHYLGLRLSKLDEREALSYCELASFKGYTASPS